MNNLPELPEPRCVQPYTLLDMQAYALAYAMKVREQALEEAAKVCLSCTLPDGRIFASGFIAQEIRALKEKK